MDQATHEQYEYARRRIKQTNSARRKQVAIQKSVMIAISQAFQCLF